MATLGNAPTDSYSRDMDGSAHEATYNGFLHFTVVGIFFVLCCVTGLAVGGIRHAWLSAVIGVILAHVATAIGLFSASISWRAPAVVLGLLLLMLLLY